MKRTTFTPQHAPVSVEVSRFTGSGGVSEFHIMARPKERADIGQQLRWLHIAYTALLRELGLPHSSAVLRRLFCSDLVNQVPELRASAWCATGETPNLCALSLTDQAPAAPAKVALWAYHIANPAGSLQRKRNAASFSLGRGELTHHWSTGLQDTTVSSSFHQTRKLLKGYSAVLAGESLSLADNVVRTWLYVRDIDNNYPGLVVARREHFAGKGLTPDTHFIASSGIGGGSSDPAALVTMDAYAIAGLQPGQIRYLSAPTHLGPTSAYGVTFERGTSVSYRDRKHIIISGTASINPAGEIVHPGDVARQLERTFDNIEALLTGADATMADMNHFIVYVRDPTDHAWIERSVRSRISGAPCQVLLAQVCRPGWLVEIEGMACVPVDCPDLPPF